MIVTAWSNGSPRDSGAGYGLKLAIEDRDTYFTRSWQSVTIVFPDGREAEVNVAKRSFWGSACRELISAEIGRWLLAERLAPWNAGRPPKVLLSPVGEARFSLKTA
jgi:hypothetical protein